MQPKNRSTILQYLEQQSNLYLVLLSLDLGMLLGFIDYLTGPEIVLSAFYFLPVAIAAYFVSRRAGLVIAGFCIFVWLLSDFADGKTYVETVAYYWNPTIRFISFAVVAFLLSALRTAADEEKQLARFDFLTGAANARFFYELANLEMSRSRRYDYILSLTHMDVDNFKQVNDTWGHNAGDDFLRMVVKTIQDNVRETDVVARLGGDEFAVLLPNTGQAEAQVAVKKVQQVLMKEVQKHQYPVSFSFGVVTCLDPSQTIVDLLKKADDLTYAAKNSGKNTIKFGLAKPEAP